MSLELFGDKAEEESTVPLIESPTDMRPDLSEYGIVEHDRGICEDTYENRSMLRQNGFQWVPVYTETGNATGLIEARSLEQMKERRLLSLQGKRALLADPLSNNSNYLTGLDLIVDSEACKVVPPWVLSATRAYVKEQEAGGPPTAKRAPKPMPTRCREFTSEGIRCMLWASGNIKDDGLCRMHLGKNRKTGADIERARAKLMQSAPYAVDTLEHLMENAISEPVKLKAATEILDRAGVRAGMDIGIDIDLKDSRSPAQIIAERLARLKSGAQMIETQFSDTNVQDAEVVIDTPEIFTPQPEPEDQISAEELEELS